jgi:transcription termination/antitermination protein NusA
MPAAGESPSSLFERVLKVPRSLADRLEAEGFTSLEEVAYVPFAEMLQASGLDSEAARQLREAAKTYLLIEELRNEDDRDEPPLPEI